MITGTSGSLSATTTLTLTAGAPHIRVVCECVGVPTTFSELHAVLWQAKVQ